MSTVYSWGYRGRRVDELECHVAHLGAVIIDTRKVPYSRFQQWSRESLRQQFGSRYVHVPGFGNVRYQETAADAVQLADPDAGLAAVGAILAARPIILLCMCREHEQCHRSTVAALIAERFGVPVVPLGDTQPEQQPAQLGLFRASGAMNGAMTDDSDLSQNR
jgi:uncharacterized protein (DUF488 family)